MFGSGLVAHFEAGFVSLVYLFWANFDAGREFKESFLGRERPSASEWRYSLKPGGIQLTEKVLTERKGKVAIVTINRPEVHNCVDNEIASGMNAVFDELERDAGDGLRSSRS